jgi:uncharacterized membrane protein AbrB (regulator of aidB expression)
MALNETMPSPMEPRKARYRRGTCVISKLFLVALPWFALPELMIFHGFWGLVEERVRTALVIGIGCGVSLSVLRHCKDGVAIFLFMFYAGIALAWIGLYIYVRIAGLPVGIL